MAGSKNRIGRLLGAAVIVGSIAVPLSVTLMPVAGASAVSVVRITSFTITGTAAQPIVTVKGSGFGATRPAADPAGHPNGQDGCPAFPAKPPSYIANDGYDYGSGKLFLWDTTATWRGGNFVSGSELDCIGLRITAWTRTKIVFRPGTAYDHSALEGGHRYILATGDSVQVDVLGATKTITY